MRLVKTLGLLALALALALPGRAWAAKAYHLKEPLPPVTNLGVPFSSAMRVGGKVVFDTSDGNRHLVAGLNLDGFTLLHINLTKGRWQVASHAPGRKGALPLSAFAALHDKLYFAPMGSLYKFDPTDGTLAYKKDLGRYVPQELVLGDDNKLYIGTQSGPPGGRIFQYDPDTDALVDLGVPGVRPAETYLSSLCCDGRYVYVAIHQSQFLGSPEHFYLGIINLADKSITYHWDQDRDAGGGVMRSNRDQWLYRRIAAGGGSSWWRLIDGQVQPASQAEQKPGYQDLKTRAPLKLGIYPDHWKEMFNYAFDFSQMVYWDGQPASIIRYRTPADSGRWITKSITFAQPPVSPVKPFKILPLNGANPLLVFGNGYFPAVKYDYKAGKVKEYLGFPLISPYSLLQAPSAYYLCGYPGALLRYDPARPWTLTEAKAASDGNNPGDPGKTNPYFTKARYGKWNQYSTFSRDGTVWTGGPHRYSGDYSLIWYKPATGESGEIVSKVPFRSLVAASQRHKICWGGNKDQILVYDAATKKLERTITVNTGLPAPGNVLLAPSEDESVLAVVVDIGDRTGATKKLVKVNVTDGSTTWSKPMPAGFPCGSPDQGAPERRLIMGPDGYLWLFLGDRIYRAAGDGTFVAVTEELGFFGELMFSAADLLIYNCYTDNNLRVIYGILEPGGPVAP